MSRTCLLWRPSARGDPQTCHPAARARPGQFATNDGRAATRSYPFRARGLEQPRPLLIITHAFVVRLRALQACLVSADLLCQLLARGRRQRANLELHLLQLCVQVRERIVRERVRAQRALRPSTTHQLRALLDEGFRMLECFHVLFCAARAKRDLAGSVAIRAQRVYRCQSRIGRHC